MIFTFEGCEGSGKSTLIKEIRLLLLDNGYTDEDIIITKEPGSPLLETTSKIRELIFDNEMDAVTEAYLFAADRSEHIREILEPNVKSDKIVLCDRFIDSSVAYQGYGRELGSHLIYQINSEALSPVDDLSHLFTTFFIDVKPEEGLTRINKSKSREINRLDKEELDFHNRVYNGYMSIIELDHEDRFKVIRNDEDNIAFAAFAAYEIIKDTMENIGPL